MKTRLPAQLAATGVALYFAVVGILLKDTSLGIWADLAWGLVVAAALLLLLALWYLAALRSTRGRNGDASSSSDIATVLVRLPPDRALARVRTIAENAFPTAEFRTIEDDLLIIKPGGWWIGNSTVRAGARQTAQGAELRLTSESKKLINNGVCRGMIGRLVQELASATVLDEHGVRPLRIS